MSNEEKVYTIQKTSKLLKFHSFMSGAFIAVGLLMVFAAGEDTHMMFWGALIGFVGICYKAVNRVRIWWNHK